MGGAVGTGNHIYGYGENAEVYVTKTGGGTVILGGNNTFTGGVFINNGVVQLGSSTALNTSTTGTPVNGVSFASAGASTGTLALGGNNAAVSFLSTANSNNNTAAI